MKKIIPLFFIMILQFNLFAEGKDLPDDIMLTGHFGFSDLILDFDNINKNSSTESVNQTDLSYYSASSSVFGFSIFYNNFIFSFTKGLSDSTKYQGNSELINLELGYFNKFLGAEFYYQKYNGYYLSDPEKAGYAELDPETNRPDLKTSNIGADFYFRLFDFKDLFNIQKNLRLDGLNEYHLNTGLKQSGITENGLSIALLLLFSVNRITFNSDHSLVPPNLQVDYDKYYSIKNGEFTSYSIAPGIGAMFSFYNFYVSSALFIGAGPQKVYYDTGTETYNDNNVNVLVNFRIALGYYGDTIIWGTQFFVEVGASEISEKAGIDPETEKEVERGISVDAIHMRFNIFAGTRL